MLKHTTYSFKNKTHVGAYITYVRYGIIQDVYTILLNTVTVSKHVNRHFRKEIYKTKFGHIMTIILIIE